MLISHRLGAICDADRITESGSHGTLLAAGGEYARLFRMQAEGYRPAGIVDG